MTPLKAIRAKCLDCVGTAQEVRLCATSKCPLHPYRFGKRPQTVEKNRDFPREDEEGSNYTADAPEGEKTRASTQLMSAECKEEGG